jgi:hypothetical protein
MRLRLSLAILDKLLWRVSRCATGEAGRRGSVGPLLLSSTIGVNRSTIRTTSTIRRRWVVFGESSAKFGRDNQRDCVVSTANVTHTQKYDIATKNGRNRPEKRLKLIVGDLECACQVLPHLVFLIPTLEEREQVRIAGKGDKIQILLFLCVFHTKRTKTSAFLWVCYLILGSITSWRGVVGGTLSDGRWF